MANTKKHQHFGIKGELIKLLGQLPCDGLDPQLGGCPFRRHGMCREVEKLDYCAVQAFADHLIANGVTVQNTEGCEYCNTSESIYHHSSAIHDSMDEDVYVSGNVLVVDIGCHTYGTTDIKFCPMCGRKLAEPPKGE